MYVNHGLGKELDFKLKNDYEITFFVACLDEENNIQATFENIITAVKKFGYTYQILVIDDCSTDRTVEIIEDYIRKHPDIRIDLVKNKENRGLGRNYVDASYLSSGEYFKLVNGDNAEPQESLVAIIGNLGKADMIIPFFGSNDKRNSSRTILSKFFTRLVNFISNNQLAYYNGPVLHKRINIIRWHSDTYGFAYQAEIITRLLEEGATYIEINIVNIPRHEGITKAFRLMNILSVSHSLLQIMIRRMRGILFFRKYSRYGSKNKFNNLLVQHGKNSA